MSTQATTAQINYLRDLQDRYAYRLWNIIDDDEMERIRSDARLLRASHEDPAIQARIDALMAEFAPLRDSDDAQARKAFLRAAHEELTALFVAARRAAMARVYEALTVDPETLTKAEASAAIDALVIR